MDQDVSHILHHPILRVSYLFKMKFCGTFIAVYISWKKIALSRQANEKV
jgi:hypothetical protein